MKQSGFSLLAICLLAGMPLAAHAQNPASTAASTLGFGIKKPFQLQVGTYIPTDSTLKNSISKNFIRVGASYDIWKSPVLVPVVIGAFVDGVLPKDKDLRQGSNSFSMIGYGPQVKIYNKPPLIPVRFFGGLAVGPYMVRAKALGQSKSKTVPGGKISLGAEFMDTFVATVDYTHTNKVSVDGVEYKPDGYGVALGLRF